MTVRGCRSDGSLMSMWKIFCAFQISRLRLTGRATWGGGGGRGEGELTQHTGYRSMFSLARILFPQYVEHVC